MIFLIKKSTNHSSYEDYQSPYIEEMIALSYHYKILILTAFAIQEKMYRLGRCYAQQRFSLPIRQPEGKGHNEGQKHHVYQCISQITLHIYTTLGLTVQEKVWGFWGRKRGFEIP